MKTKLTLLLAIAGLGLTPSQAELTIPDSKPNAPEQQAAPQAEQKAVAYLGVLTRDVPEELRTQFSLAEGFGLLVEDVMPGSPAATAGLKHHDVLLKLADQQLVNAEQLLTLVRSHKKAIPSPHHHHWRQRNPNHRHARRAYDLHPPFRAHPASLEPTGDEALFR
ncbi:MAG: PDZ domain-containing protein [Verrucomicrobiaceae bacterium]|nr:PDZ domain-containing protein [Verrucomicrobiaceae bacterium]